MHLNPPVATAVGRSKAVVLLLLSVEACFVSLVLLKGCIMPFLSMRRCFLDFECSIIVVNVFVVLLCRNLTTAESMVNVWRS